MSKRLIARCVYNLVEYDWTLSRELSGQLQLALALHPDKNGAPNADEAFKSGFY